MRKFLSLIMFLLLAVGVAQAQTPTYNYGDKRSVTLAGKAWQALTDNDLNAVVAYTQKCFDLYESKALQMMVGRTDYVVGTDAEIHALWALNDVATCYFIRGKAYRKAGDNVNAKVAYQKIIDSFRYAQCFSPNPPPATGGTFWKPAEGAADEIAIIDSGLDVDYGDMRSSTLTTKAWQALAEGASGYPKVHMYAAKCLALYGATAATQQAERVAQGGYVVGTNDQIFAYWALNDVATILYIEGEAYRRAGQNTDALAAYNRLRNEFLYGQCYDETNAYSKFWKPAEAAADSITMITDGLTDLNFGNMTSEFLVGQAWAALETNNLPYVQAYVNKIEALYKATALSQQASLNGEFPVGENNYIFGNFWALNDVGTAKFILGKTLANLGRTADATAAFQDVITTYPLSQCWDPGGWFWRPAEAAAQEIADLNAAP